MLEFEDIIHEIRDLRYSKKKDIVDQFVSHKINLKIEMVLILE